MGFLLTMFLVYLSVNLMLLQDVEELIEEVQEARRIKLLHQPSKVHLYCLSRFVIAGRLFVDLTYYPVEQTH